jgi:hypothetical protein
MSELSLPRPDPDESSPYYRGYISEVPTSGSDVTSWSRSGNWS